MNETVNKYLLAWNKFIPEIRLKETGFTYSAFQHDKAYGSCKDLVNRTKSDRVLKDKVFKIKNNPKYDGYERKLPLMVYKSFDKNSKGSGINSISNQQSNEIHKPIIKKF